MKTKVVEVTKKKEEEAEEPQQTRKDPVNYKCKECSLMFGNKTTLKKHILVNHPKTVNCESCDQTFDQFWKLEIHMKTHSSEKLFECKVCDKKFALQWRLKKHMKGHTDQNVKFCHYFNMKLLLNAKI